ncbi:MAG: hypothetical protein JKY94_09585 [Rhodobacteraceae bacterium]|nr:hypothetical protein [Paracoccaceae bacterium]
MTIQISFSEAVKYAEDEIERRREEIVGSKEAVLAFWKWQKMRDSGTENKVVGSFRKGDLILIRQGKLPEPEIFCHYTAEHIAPLIEEAKVDRVSFDALLGVTCDLLRRNEPLPKPLQSWLVEYLEGKFIAPKPPKGRMQNEGWWRNHAMTMIIEDLVNKGLFATRNHESPETSACDAVASAMRKLEYTPNSYEGIRKIWNTFKD